jgi:hypothetical protein
MVFLIFFHKKGTMDSNRRTISSDRLGDQGQQARSPEHRDQPETSSEREYRFTRFLRPLTDDSPSSSDTDSMTVSELEQRHDQNPLDHPSPQAQEDRQLGYGSARLRELSEQHMDHRPQSEQQESWQEYHERWHERFEEWRDQWKQRYMEHSQMWQNRWQQSGEERFEEWQDQWQQQLLDFQHDQVLQIHELHQYQLQQQEEWHHQNQHGSRYYSLQRLSEQLNRIAIFTDMTNAHVDRYVIHLRELYSEQMINQMQQETDPFMQDTQINYMEQMDREFERINNHTAQISQVFQNFSRDMPENNFQPQLDHLEQQSESLLQQLNQEEQRQHSVLPLGIEQDDQLTMEAQLQASALPLGIEETFDQQREQMIDEQQKNSAGQRLDIDLSGVTGETWKNFARDLLVQHGNLHLDTKYLSQLRELILKPFQTCFNADESKDLRLLGDILQGATADHVSEEERNSAQYKKMEKWVCKKWRERNNQNHT